MNRKIIFSLLSAFLFVSFAFAQSNERGIDYYRAGLYDAAKIFFTGQTYQSPKDQAESYYYLGLIAFDTDDADQASQYFNKAVETDPRYPFGLIGQGKIALKNENKKAADDLFKKATNLAKKDPSVQTAIAEVYMDAGMEPPANDALGKARKINKKYPGIYRVEGDMLAKQKKVGDAASRYGMAITFDERDKIAYLKLARFYKSINPELSLQYLDQLIAIDPNYIPAYAEIGDINYTRGNYGKAIEAYEKFVSIPGVPLKQKSNYAELLYFTDQYEKSLQQVDKVLQLDPNNLVMYRIQAYDNFKLEKYELALQQIQEVLRKMPEDKHIFLDYMTLARTYMKLKQPANAAQALLKAEKTFDANTEARQIEIYKELIDAYDDAKDYDNAIKAYTKYFEIADHIQPLDYLSLGILYQRKATEYYAKLTAEPGDKEALYTDSLNYYVTKGEEAFTKLIELRPNNYIGYLNRANISYLVEAVEHAKTEDKLSGRSKSYFEEAIEIMEANNENGARTRNLIESYDYLSNYYITNDNNPKVIEYSKKILELDPNNAKAKHILDLLNVKY